MATVDDETDEVTAFLDPLVVRAKARLGKTLHNKWRLDVLLGVGGMAAVYAATHRNGSRAAVKILHTELSASADIRSRFMREGHAANAVGHDGAVRVLDDDIADDGAPYLVTELLDGETLEDRRVRFGGRLTEDDVLSVADQLLDVLIAAHAKGVIHRDIKPANVFLTRVGQLKVLDFGIARLRELSTASLATKSGSAMGTPAFMSPEQARGLWNEVDGRSDVWSVGATIWHALTGKLVHEGRTSNEELLSAMTKPAPPILSVLPKLSPAVAQVVDRALAFEKEKRWLDAKRMQEGVRRAYHDRHSAPITTAPRLTVPETVPNRTLSSAPAQVLGAPLPTTGRPVANSQGGRAAPSRRMVATAAMGVVAVGIVVSGIAWVVSAAHGSASTGASSSTATQATAVQVPLESSLPTTTSEPASSETSVPAIAATDLPTAVATAAAPTRPLPPAVKPAAPVAPADAPTAPVSIPSPAPPLPPPSPPAAAIPPATKPNCNPPYTLDPKSGKKHFKLECL
jgi:eukaryotic-like serine/threonine-protein kinase